MDKIRLKKTRFNRRKMRVKRKIMINADRPRLCISRSNRSFYAQVIDDSKRTTIVAATTLEKAFASLKSRGNSEAAKALGKIIADRAKEKKIVRVVFDRNGYLYHGKIKAFADAARENGLEF